MPVLVLSPSQQEANQYAGGVTGYNDSEEFWMRKLANRAKQLIDEQKWGITVHVVNKGSVGANVTESNRLRATEHIDLHTDAGGGHGTTVFHHSASAGGKKLAQAVYPFVSAASNLPDRGIRTHDAFVALHETVAKAIIVEHAFHDNPSEAQEIRDSIEEFALAICKGVGRYYGKTYVLPVTYLEARIHLDSRDSAFYSQAAAAKGDFIKFYPAVKDSWKGWA